ncbi:MAG TPA: hypothetical protein VMZ90_01985 [Vicinamibacterales bacterium]|nr:hypothetical protein [Vicinamibacterales bacterium]
MEQQRPLRLGDLVDDYCPRERRITNHAIVAIVEDAIRQTRCTACEADHVYKGGKAPLRKKPKDEQSVLYDQVLANVTAGPAASLPPEPVAPVVVIAAVPEPKAAIVEPAAVAAATSTSSDAHPTPEPVPVIDEGWSLNRRLIRASLPRIEGQSPVPRVIPEFTMHQRNTRGSQQFRGGGGNGYGAGNGPSGNGWHDRSAAGNGSSNGHRQNDGQPGADPNGQRPGAGRRRRRHKAPRPPQN